MGQDTKQDRKDRLKGVGMEGSQSRSDSENVRARRGAQRELDFSQRFDPQYFELDSNNRVTLKLTDKPRTRTEHLDFMKRHGDVGADNPIDTDRSAAGGTPVYASCVESYEVADWSFFIWPIPDDMDRTRSVGLDLGCIERNNTTDPGSAPVRMSWDLALWRWESGQTLTRAADQTLQVVNQLIGDSKRDIDQRVAFTIPPSLLNPATDSIKMKLTRVSATGTDPNGVAIHEILLTYGVLNYHTHE